MHRFELAQATSTAQARELLAETKGGVVKEARVVLGAVAPIPWRSTRTEQALVGKKLDEATIIAAARAATVGAQPLSDNGYKVGLVQTLVRRTLTSLA